MECPCCGQPMKESKYYPPFCWACGLSPGEPAEHCDDAEHRAAQSASEVK